MSLPATGDKFAGRSIGGQRTSGLVTSVTALERICISKIARHRERLTALLGSCFLPQLALSRHNINAATPTNWHVQNKITKPAESQRTERASWGFHEYVTVAADLPG
jgi:hypothetical protein